MTEKLAKCGCGSEAYAHMIGCIETEGYYISCEECGTKTPIFETFTEAVKTWNTVMGKRIEECKCNESCSENVDHPTHYKGDKFECIDVMEDVYGNEAVKHFCMLNAFKYIYRQNKKNGIEDVKKAIWYLNKYLEIEERDNQNA